MGIATSFQPGPRPDKLGVTGSYSSPKFIGGELFGPLGLVLFGNAKERVHDTRQLYLLIQSDSWAYGSSVNPAFGLQARQFAQQINLAAAQLETPQGSVDARLERLGRLGELRDAGVLTAEEFESEKARILDS